MIEWVEKHDDEPVHRLTPSAEAGAEEANYFVRTTDGMWWHVASINKRGRLILARSIPKDIGLDVDEQGRIKMEDE